VRHDNGSVIPRHVFMKGANLVGDDKHRLSDRINCFEGTFVHLTERFHGKEVFLVGTANLSTLLAKRTDHLMTEVTPDALMVMTSE